MRRKRLGPGSSLLFAIHLGNIPPGAVLPTNQQAAGDPKAGEKQVQSRYNQSDEADRAPRKNRALTLYQGQDTSASPQRRHLFMPGSAGDLNVRGAYLHMAADAAITLGVLVVGVAILYTGWAWLDPAFSLVIALLVIAGTWSLLRDSANLALHAVPPGIDAQQVEAYLASVEGVTEVHDLHIRDMSTTETALTAHLVFPGAYPGDAKRREISDGLRERFAIGHATIQIETGESGHACELAPTHVV